MEEILQGIKDAIKEEKAQQEKYRKLKDKAEDENVKALFEQLIKDEIGHEKLLRSRYEALKSSMQK